MSPEKACTLVAIWKFSREWDPIGAGLPDSTMAVSGAIDENCCLEFSNFVSTKDKNITRTKHMKKLLTLRGIASVAAVLALMAACQTTGTTQSMSQKETLLAQSGFKVVTVTNPKQQQAVNGLAQGRCSA